LPKGLSVLLLRRGRIVIGREAVGSSMRAK
jgi:hypothetical protein